MTVRWPGSGSGNVADWAWTSGLAAEAAGAALSGPGNLPLTGIITDSRVVAPGNLFVALRGEIHDGHEFVDAAWTAGAAAVMVERELAPPAGRAVLRAADSLRAYGNLGRFRRDRYDGLVVGITGSVGKSSTKELCGEVLAAAMPTARSRSSYNNEIGLPATLLELRDEQRAVVLELAMRGLGQIAYLAAICRPQIGVITNIGVSHVGVVGSRERVAQAKGELLDALGADGVAVLNADDRHLPQLAARHLGRTLWFGLEQPADVSAESVSLRGLAGSTFRLRTPLGAVPVELALPGRHSVANALAAAAVGVAAGLSLAQIAAGLRAAATLPQRLEVRPLAVGATLINDAYNAAPDSVRAALGVLTAEPCRGRRIAVLGDMLELGAASEVEHLRIGHEAARAADVVIAVGELGAQIALAARDEGGAEVLQAADPEAAAALLRRLLRAGDLVLLKASRAVGLERAAALLEVDG